MPTRPDADNTGPRDAHRGRGAFSQIAVKSPKPDMLAERGLSAKSRCVERTNRRSMFEENRRQGSVRLLRDQDDRSTPNTSTIRQSDGCKVEKVVQANANAGVGKKRLLKESAWLTKPGLKRAGNGGIEERKRGLACSRWSE